MPFIGNQPADKFLTLEKQVFTTSATDTYTLDREVSSVNDIELFLNNVRQEPTEAYTISGTTLTLASAITASDSMYCIYQGRAVGTQSPAVGSVTNAMLASGSFSNITGTGTLTNFTSTGIDDNATSTAITIDTAQNVGIGTLNASIVSINNASEQGRLNVSNNGAEQLEVFPGDASNKVTLQAFNRSTSTSNSFRYFALTHEFTTNATERMRIDSSGNVFIGKTSASLTTNGFYTAEAGARIIVARAGGQSASFCRNTNDGEIVNFFQDGTKEGNISVSGTTVSYNGFTGTHWSRLSDNSKPIILKGTILESLDEMMDWYQVQFDITETDDEGNETTRTEKQSYVLSEGQSVGDVITYNFEGIDYQATIVQEGEVKHTKSKISDTVDAKNVYGVFMDWDNDDDTVNDMYVAQTGTFVVRINSAETVSKGDLIQSNGDGTGKVQADDIIRASTVAKVLSTTKIETYEDGSYIVPCSLHC
jgi:hypothetical protein